MKQGKKNLKYRDPNQDFSHSLILQKALTYTGPCSIGKRPIVTPTCAFQIDPLYCYPTLTFVSTKTMHNHAIIPHSEFTYPDCADLKEVINEFCQLSPFKTLEHTSPEITYSSLNTLEYGLDRFESESNRISASKRALVKQLLQDLGKKDEFFSSDCSVNLDISDTQNLDVSSLYSKIHNVSSSVSSKSIFYPTDTNQSIIPTNEEELITYTKDSYIVELLPENSDLSFLRCSADVSGISEGSLHISTRCFLPKSSASKSILKNISGPYDCLEEITVKNIPLLQAEVPTGLSPVYRKLVLCGQRDHSTSLEIKSCMSCSGFLSAVSLEFSNMETQSRGFIQYSVSKLLRLFSDKIFLNLADRNISWVSFGFEHCAIVTMNGQVFTWGYGASGVLGHGSLLSCTFPTLVSRLPPVKYLECGAYHTATITENEEIYAWGRGDVNQLGIPPQSLTKDHLGYFTSVPIKIDFFSNVQVKGLACGEAHTLVIDHNGSIYSFGWAEDGQLGLPSMWIQESYMSFAIRKIVYLNHKKIVKISAGALFSIAITENGEIYSWGNGELGQLGQGNTIKLLEFPSVVKSLEKEIIVDALCGESHVICISKNGNVYGWGQGLAGIFEMRGGNFPYGSDVVCYLPRKLVEFDISHRVIVR